MKTVSLYGKRARGRVAEVSDGDDYDLVMRHRWNVNERVRPNGSTVGPYAYTSIRRGGRTVNVEMHRLLMPGVPQVDHKDGNGLNNQRSNLRDATNQQNHANEGKTRTYGGKPTSSRFKGVYRHKASGRWHAQINAGGNHRSLGYFSDETDAALAYDTAAREEFGEFARLNFPEEAA